VLGEKSSATGGARICRRASPCAAPALVRAEATSSGAGILGGRARGVASGTLLARAQRTRHGQAADGVGNAGPVVP